METMFERAGWWFIAKVSGKPKLETMFKRAGWWFIAKVSGKSKSVGDIEHDPTGLQHTMRRIRGRLALGERAFTVAPDLADEILVAFHKEGHWTVTKRKMPDYSPKHLQDLLFTRVATT